MFSKKIEFIPKIENLLLDNSSNEHDKQYLVPNSTLYFDRFFNLLYTYFMKELIVEPKYDGKKLNNFLLDSFDGLSLNVLYKTLRKKDIRVNNIRVSENVTLHTNDHVKVFLLDEQLFKSASALIDIVYEDENIVVVNKPSGIEVVGEHSLTSYLREFYEKKLMKENDKLATTANHNVLDCKQSIFMEPCHRLDRNTTGLTLFAKNEEALAILLEKFKNREIEKIYRATVYGIPKVKEQLLNAYLFKDSKKSMVYISNVPKKGYVKIATYYKVLETSVKEHTSVLEVNLLTGKTHQIRAHLAYIGHPIIGDRKVWK